MCLREDNRLLQVHIFFRMVKGTSCEKHSSDFFPSEIDNVVL